MKSLRIDWLRAGAAASSVIALMTLDDAMAQSDNEKPAAEPVAAQSTQTAKPVGPVTDALSKRQIDLSRAQSPAPPRLQQTTASMKVMELDNSNVYDFLVWAATSPRGQKELVRAAIMRRAGDEKISAEIQALYPKILDDDFDFALVALGVLGELRALGSIKFLEGVLNQPYPKETVRADPGLTKRESIELLQSKAVQGLAYLGDPAADDIVFKAAASHPARAVRSAAVDALLYNARSEATRERLIKTLRPEDQIFLDQVSKGAVQSPEEFNKRLAGFYERHPEAKFEAPGEPKGPERPDRRLKLRTDEKIAPQSGDQKPR